MFSFFKRNPKISRNLNFIGADMHNHLLPGIDDGSQDVETSLQLIDVLLELGYQKFVCTPHVILEVHPNDETTISDAWQVLKNGLAQKGLDIPIEYSAEYMLNFDFDSILNEGRIIPFGNKQVLIEMSYAVESPNIKDAIFELQTKGFRPILAHPERYPYYFHKVKYYEELMDAGCDLQINMLSLTGYYGKPIKKMAEKLIDNGWITWIGTDLHHHRHLGALIQLSNDSKVLRYLDKIKNLKNPSLLNT
ncbi:MAG: CpsB/CapC family capsule biosynthesis tyrosine phosphatase [Bacteroidota bacterium]